MLNGQVHEFKVDEVYTSPGWQQAVDQELNGTDKEDPGKQWQDILSRAFIDQSEEIPSPPVVLAINNGDTESTIATLGNFSVLTGKAKSRKTFFVVCLVAALLSDKPVLDVIAGSLPADKKMVLVFDTEQARFHTQRMQKRILRLAGMEHCKNLVCYSLRSFSPSDRLQTIEYALYHTPGLGLVVIDGIRDLGVDPILNPDEAILIVGKLMKWSEDLNIHIICILHQNKTDGNVRGHLGTEAVNKAETTLSVTRDGENRDISIVSPEYCRDREFEQLAFSIDEDGLPCSAGDWEPTARKRTSKNSIDPDRLPDPTHKSVLDLVFDFDVSKKLKYKELQSEIQKALLSIGIKIGETKVRDFIKLYSEQNWITTNGTPGTRNFYYSIGNFKTRVELETFYTN
jgi:hypothetical protein